MARKYLGACEKWFLILTLAFSSCLIMLQIIMRACNHGLAWSEELARFLFIWQVWIGIAYATSRWNHLRITFLRDLTHGRVKDVWELFVIVWWFIFGAFLVCKGFEFTLMTAARGQRSTALRIPMAYVYAGIPVGCTLMNIHLLEVFIEKLRHLGREDAV